jgi:hypothetical protein
MAIERSMQGHKGPLALVTAADDRKLLVFTHLPLVIA